MNAKRTLPEVRLRVPMEASILVWRMSNVSVMMKMIREDLSDICAEHLPGPR
mgnify:CR=1 FL=1